MAQDKTSSDKVATQAKIDNDVTQATAAALAHNSIIIASSYNCNVMTKSSTEVG